MKRLCPCFSLLSLTVGILSPVHSSQESQRK
ncbi:unnamed protein product [Tetraodon nigroviridis]|uniref:Chromosome 1 SCAF14995, whole genome shotgun sequence n=1 Tax=Tetraodon nigroviridis TaxID=99883 RepID=Q4RUJ2_TETNG|nr:unnamed protein product [Tetraodon nigroviridis]